MFCVVAKRYILQQKCLNKWEHAGTTFSPIHRPWAPQCRASQTTINQSI